MCLTRNLREDALIVLYDDDCGFCEVMLAMLLRWDRATRVRPVSIQSPPRLLSRRQAYPPRASAKRLNAARSTRSLDDEAILTDDAQIDIENRVQRVGDRGELAHRQVGAARLDVRDVRGRGLQSLGKLRLGEAGVMAALADRLPTSLAVGSERVVRGIRSRYAPAGAQRAARRHP
jgi:hypothetical protein